MSDTDPTHTTGGAVMTTRRLIEYECGPCPGPHRTLIVVPEVSD